MKIIYGNQPQIDYLQSIINQNIEMVAKSYPHEKYMDSEHIVKELDRLMYQYVN